MRKKCAAVFQSWCCPNSSSTFAAALVAGLRELTPIEDATVLHYAGGELPEIVYREVPARDGADTLERFVQGPFLLDPFYQAALAGRDPDQDEARYHHQDAEPGQPPVAEARGQPPDQPPLDQRDQDAHEDEHPGVVAGRVRERESPGFTHLRGEGDLEPEGRLRP